MEGTIAYVDSKSRNPDRNHPASFSAIINVVSTYSKGKRRRAIKHTNATNSHNWPARPSYTCGCGTVAMISDKLISTVLNNLLPFVFIIVLITITSTSVNASANSESVPKHNATKNSNRNSNNNIIQQLVLYSLKINHTITNTSSHHAIITQNESYKFNTRNLERVSRMIHDGRMKSACVQAGLWAIFYNQNFQNIAAILYASSNSQDQTCTQNQINETDYSQYKSIRHIGHSNLLASALSLYTGPFFSLHELYFDGSLLSLPSPELFHSYGFTGNDSWTLYEHTNFTGHAICLMSSGGNIEDAVTSTFDRVVYNRNKGVEFTIGAIQKGCTDKHNRTVIYPSGETVVEWTNKPIGSDRKLENIEFRIHNNEVPSLKLISEFDGNILTTDAEELRLPQKYTFNRFILSTGANNESTQQRDNEEPVISWTVFSGTEFTGKSKCFHSSKSNSASNANATWESGRENDINFDFKIPFRQELFLVGSIKKGCFESNETEELPVLELHLSEDDDQLDHHSLFFISFIIGLILLVIVILLSIAMISYYYIGTKRRQRRAEWEARAMRS